MRVRDRTGWVEACVPWRVEFDWRRDLSGLQEAEDYLWVMIVVQGVEGKPGAYYCCTLLLLFVCRQTQILATVEIAHRREHIREWVPVVFPQSFKYVTLRSSYHTQISCNSWSRKEYHANGRLMFMLHWPRKE
jgi:hypothetical protein